MELVQEWTSSAIDLTPKSTGHAVIMLQPLLQLLGAVTNSVTTETTAANINTIISVYTIAGGISSIYRIC